MTEKNAVKSETVSPAREFLEAYMESDDCDYWPPRDANQVVKILDAYASHVSSLSSQAIGAAAKEAAEAVESCISEYFGESWHGCEKDMEAIILRAIEKARKR